MIHLRRKEDVLKLWCSVEPYRSFPCATIAWRLLPAIENYQYRAFYKGDECVGLVTWAFMTREEFDSRDYSGPEIFARDDGEMLVVVDMIASGGRSDVLSISRDMQRYLYNCYPMVSRIYGHRGKRVGFFANKGRSDEVHAA